MVYISQKTLRVTYSAPKDSSKDNLGASGLGLIRVLESFRF